jgi:hypothetical protein
MIEKERGWRVPSGAGGADRPGAGQVGGSGRIKDPEVRVAGDATLTADNSQCSLAGLEHSQRILFPFGP